MRCLLDTTKATHFGTSKVIKKHIILQAKNKQKPLGMSFQGAECLKQKNFRPISWRIFCFLSFRHQTCKALQPRQSSRLVWLVRLCGQ